MKRCLVVLAFLPHLTGCLGYVYPTVNYVPEQVVPNKDGSVHAFRVDIDRTERKPAPPSTVYTLTKLPVDYRGVIPSQLEIGQVTGVLDPLGIALNVAHERSEYSMSVRFYRPGYQMIEVKSWDKSRQLQWLPAADLSAQERAIDDLLTDPEAPVLPMQKSQTVIPQRASWWELKDQKTPPLGLQPGAHSPSQRAALMFAAGEYERLATSPGANAPAAQTSKERLQQKAIWLRRFAEQAPLR
ncbi:MAG: hypothetical protein HYX68_24325 [Planctomycetes bacterium]|nr:hypothetical protein [Planctomycetota bacterium]